MIRTDRHTEIATPKTLVRAKKCPCNSWLVPIDKKFINYYVFFLLGDYQIISSNLRLKKRELIIKIVYPSRKIGQ